MAERYPDADLGRVAMRGWSFSGYLAAMAVLRRPDVFHAAVAGAPVTDKLLYDTHWQERFFGHPGIDPRPYEAGSLIADAPKLRRPLMLIHGLMDDNVHPVHTFRLSAALFAAGRPHTVLPLPTASHMSSTEIAAQLMEVQASLPPRRAEPGAGDLRSCGELRHLPVGVSGCHGRMITNDLRDLGGFTSGGMVGDGRTVSRGGSVVQCPRWTVPMVVVSDGEGVGEG